MTTKLAAVNLAISDAIMSSRFLAFRAINTFRPASILEKFKARIISRKLMFKVFYRVGFHRFSPISIYTYTIAQNIPVVKG
jgi:hypothetical protein